MSQQPLVKSIHHIRHGCESQLLSINKNHKPLITINSGGEVSFDNTHAGFNKITRHTTDADMIEMNPKTLMDIEECMGKIYVDGPVYVNGAEPGDTLKVEILELQTGDWGWTAIFPGLGLLQDEMPGTHIKTLELRPDHAVFKPGVRIPAQPFYGTMAVAQAEDGDLHPLFPGNDIGGSFDCRYMGQGAVLETTMRSRIRLSVVKGRAPPKSPHYETNPERVKQIHSVGDKGEYGVLTTGTSYDIAVKDAVQGVLDWLVAEKGLTRVEACMLFSLAGNLKVMHNLGLENLSTVSASIPLGLFIE